MRDEGEESRAEELAQDIAVQEEENKLRVGGRKLLSILKKEFEIELLDKK